MKVEVYNKENKVGRQIEVPEKVFGAPWRPLLVRQVLLAQLANQRKPWAHAKGRGEVRGGGRKPWRQKGTGRARHGSIRSPLWIGGGKAHGPEKTRDYSQKVNKSMKRTALFSVLSRKLKDNHLKFYDSLAVESPKTKLFAAMLRPLLGDKRKTFNVLIVPENGNTHAARAGANIPKVKVVNPKSLNVYDLMNYENIFIETEALPLISAHYSHD